MKLIENMKKIREKNLNKIKNNNMQGITLIALVITIVILIILAGVAISLSLGNNGIFNKTKQAKENYIYSANTEKEEITNIENYLQNLNENKDENIENYTECQKLLFYANIPNANEYDETVINNEQIMNSVMKSNRAVDYMLENTETFMNEICNSEIALSELGKSEYAGYKAILNDDWFNAIMNSQYVEEFDNTSVTTPVMASNTSENGICMSSVEGNSDENKKMCYRAFDKNNSTYASTTANGKGAIAFDFKEPVVAYKIKIIPNSDGRANNKGGYIGYSDIENDINLTQILKYTNTNINSTNTYILENKSAHRIWGISNVTRWDGVVSGYPYGVCIGEIEIYCRRPIQ